MPAVRVTADWPDQLADIAELIGAPAALTLARAYGGGYLRVPLRLSEDHRLSQLIGHEAAATFCHHYGGERLQLPLAAALNRRMAREELLAEVRAGRLSISAAARQLGMTARAIRRIVRQTNEGAARARRLRAEARDAQRAQQIDLEDWLRQQG